MQQELNWGEEYKRSGDPSTEQVLPGEVIFASAEEQAQRTTELLGAGALLVTLPPPVSAARGHLGELLEELVERELARMGAPSPYLAAWSAMPEDADARLADQLFRARSVGATGFAIALGTLAAVATPVLTPDDSATLHWLADATADAPLILLVDDSDLRLLAYPTPVTLSKLLTRRRTSPSPPTSAVRCAVDVSLVLETTEEETPRDVAACAPGIEPTSLALPLPLPVTLTLTLAEPDDAIDVPIVIDDPEAPFSETQHLVDEAATTNDTRVASIDIETAIVEACTASVPPPPAPLPAHSCSPRSVTADAEPETVSAPIAARETLVGETDAFPIGTFDPGASAEGEPSATAPPAAEPPTPAAEPPTLAAEPPTLAAEPPTLAAEPPTLAAEPPTLAAAPPTTAMEPPAPAPEPPTPTPAVPDRGRSTRASRRATAGVPVAGPSDIWRGWAIALSNAKGAQPLSTFERLFTESYVPLSNAIASGLDDPRALRAYDEFRRSFERSYTDAFQTFGATNRRPKLVMDAYDIAAKQARLANARATHILVVDSMRFDLGCLIRDAISREANGIATLTTELLLWSALPTTTIRQLETFARGLDALRAPAHEEASESLRGRAAEVVRRLRVGSRELYKLDLVPAMLEARGDYDSMETTFTEIAERTAEAVARHISMLAPRTLLFIVGDHGFGIGRRGEIQTGGASPEEVLVPAQGWLVGDLH
jgi:hypothetical protein